MKPSEREYDKYLKLIIFRWNCKFRFQQKIHQEENKDRTTAIISNQHKIRTKSQQQQKYPSLLLESRNYLEYKALKPTRPTRRKVQMTLDGKGLQTPLISVEERKRRRAKRVEAANNGSRPTPSVSQRYGKESEEIITFEHINLNGINPHDKFVELTNIYRILKTMQAGVYSFNKHNLNTSNQF